MSSQSEAGEWTGTSPDESSRSIRYKLKLELRRVERSGRGESEYAFAIRRVLNALRGEGQRDLVRLLDRELARSTASENNDEPYAGALGVILADFGESEHDEARELFSYYLQRLERQGRGNEPFAQAVREALRSNDTSSLSDLLLKYREQKQRGG